MWNGEKRKDTGEYKQMASLRPETKEVACQTIAHRGCSSQFPENTMGAFRSAVAAGTHAIETDIHLTRDDVVVISHDPSLLRCFGVDRKIIDCDYSYIQTLRTVKAPHEPMPSLKDVLEYLLQPGLEDVWLLLDIKVDNHPDDVIRLIGETIFSVNSSTEFWDGRIRLGIWSFKYLEICNRYLPGFPITFIGVSVASARKFLEVPDISFSLVDAALVTSAGVEFVAEVRSREKDIFMWTVNDVEVMKWALYNRLDGVITDYPLKFRKLSENYDGEPGRISWTKQMEMLAIRILVVIFSCWKPFDGIVDKKMKREKMRIRERILEEEQNLLDS